MQGQRIIHSKLPIVPSPSGLPSQYIVNERMGSQSTFVAQQWLGPGERVLLHTHPVEETIVVLSGDGEARLGDEIVPISAGVTLYVPAKTVHNFGNTGNTPLHVIFIFPVAHFASMDLVDPETPLNS